MTNHTNQDRLQAIVEKAWHETESPIDDIVYLVKSITGPLTTFVSLGVFLGFELTGSVNEMNKDLIQSLLQIGVGGGSVVTGLVQDRKGNSLLGNVLGAFTASNALSNTIPQVVQPQPQPQPQRSDSPETGDNHARNQETVVQTTSNRSDAEYSQFLEN